MDEDLRNASDLIANPTLDLFGKLMVIMEVDSHHSTDPPTTYLVATVHSGHAARHFGDLF